MVRLLLHPSIAAEQHQVLGGDEHDAFRPDLHVDGILSPLQLDLAPQRLVAPVLPVHPIQLMAAVGEDVHRAALECVEQVPALDRILESGLAALQVDDVHLGATRGVGARHIQQAGGRKLGVRQLTLDLDVLLETDGRRRDIEHVDKGLGFGVDREHHRVSRDHRLRSRCPAS